METYFNLNQTPKMEAPTALALGTFDGFHIGHDKLIRTLLSVASQNSLESMLYTFSNHPRDLLDGGSNQQKLIISPDQKLKLIKRYNPDHLMYFPFDDYHMNIEADEFIEEILVGRLRMRHIVIGYDWRFGKRAEGDVRLLKAYESRGVFKTTIVDAIRIGDEIVSSTRIRQFLEEGRVEKAAEFLGRPFSITGKVIHGRSIGKHLGFPTANLSKETNYCTVKEGVYATVSRLAGLDYPSVTKVGRNVSFDDDACTVETHLLDFDQDLYGETLQIMFMTRIRDQIKFDRLEHLSDRIKKDVACARNYFENVYFTKRVC